MFINVYAQLGLCETEELDTAKRVESQVQLDIHSGIECSGIRLRLPGKPGEYRPDTAAKPLVIHFRQPLVLMRLALFGVAAVGLFTLDFESLQLARNCTWKRIISKGYGMDPIVGRHLFRKILNFESDHLHDR